MDGAIPAGTGARSGAGPEAEWAIAEDEVELGALLGRGGQGEVFRGRWKGRAGAVAVKRLDADMIGMVEGSEKEALERGRE